MLEYNDAPHPEGQCRLTIIIPAWNYASRLSSSLATIMAQLTNDSELIVVDDGSSDGTLAMLAAYPVPEGLRAVYVTQSNQGPAAARNRAINLASGQWVMPLDADDELCPQVIAAVEATLHTRPDAELIVGGHQAVDLKGRLRCKPFVPIPEGRQQRLHDYLLSGRISMVHGACVFKRAFLQANPYAESLRQGEDMPVFASALLLQHIVVLPTMMVTITKHGDSLRHDADVAVKQGLLVADIIFSRLPGEFAHLYPRFAAQRALSVFRRCYRAKSFDLADSFYRQAWSLSWRQALRWDYLSKWIRLQAIALFRISP